MPDDHNNTPIDPSQNGFNPMFPNPMQDYSTYEDKVNSAFGVKGFEIHADYDTETGEIVLKNTIIVSGSVLIGNRVYKTEPFTFSGENANIFLYARKQRPIGSIKEGTWDVWIDNQEYIVLPKPEYEALDGRSFKLLEIQNGRLVTDNRYLLNFSRLSRVIKGRTYTRYGSDSDGWCLIQTGKMSCPDLYRVLTTYKKQLEELNDNADAYLNQMV